METTFHKWRRLVVARQRTLRHQPHSIVSIELQFNQSQTRSRVDLPGADKQRAQTFGEREAVDCNAEIAAVFGPFEDGGKPVAATQNREIFHD